MSKLDKTTMVLSFLNMLLSLLVYMNDGRTIHCVAAVLWGIAFVGYAAKYQRTKSIGEKHE